MSLSLNHLAVFHAVAEAGGVTRGAERLMVSQPAVSKQLKDLERALHVSLLQRHGRTVRLTQAGNVLASYARRIFALAGEAEAALADLGAMRRGTLSLGATPTIGTYLLPQALVYFRQRFPGIRVEVATANGDSLGAALAEGTLELGLGDETLVFDGMQRRALTRVPFVAIAHPKSKLARRRRKVSLADLAGEPVVVRDTGATEGSPVERYLAEAGMAPGRVVSLGNTEAVKRAVEMGLGVAIVPRLAVQSEVAAGRLAILRMPELSLTRPLYEVWDGRRPRAKASRAFHCVLEHLVRGTLPNPKR
jgi:DNA-binding transcriptional LysR family regulator